MWEMSKASSGRRARAEIAHCIAVAQRSLKVGKYADAIGPLSQAARLAPRDPVVLNDLGTAYLDAGRPADGVPWLQRSIALEPRVGYVHYNLAMALEQTGDDDSAILAYRRAVTLDPDRAMAHAMMADVQGPVRVVNARATSRPAGGRRALLPPNAGGRASPGEADSDRRVSFATPLEVEHGLKVPPPATRTRE
jgi:Flp pilus assembly protein TadD